MKVKKEVKIRPLNELGSIAIMDMETQARAKHRYWRDVYPYVAPYADALMSLNSINDNYGFDDGRSIVSYFLCNATTWKGEVAKSVKNELKIHLKNK